MDVRPAIGSALALVLAFSAPALAAHAVFDGRVEVSAERATFGQYEAVTVTITNVGPTTIEMPDSASFRVRDDHGHSVFRTGALHAVVHLRPGESYEGTWWAEACESFDEAQEHGDPAWTAHMMAGVRAPGAYVFEWWYRADGAWHTIGLPLGVVEERPTADLPWTATPLAGTC